jgi:hypothetical protein
MNDIPCLPEQVPRKAFFKGEFDAAQLLRVFGSPYNRHGATPESRQEYSQRCLETRQPRLMYYSPKRVQCFHNAVEDWTCSEM